MTRTDQIYGVLISRHADFSPAELSELASLPPAEITEALEALARQGRAAVLPNDRYVSDKAAERLRETARRIAAAYHKQYPLRRAVPRENLEAPLLKAAKFKDFAAVLDWLADEGILVSEGALGVRLLAHKVVLPLAWQKAADEILQVYTAAGLQPPAPGNFKANYPRDVSVVGILQVFCESGQLIDISDGLYVSAQAIEETKDLLRRLADTPEGITVGGVRNAMGASRKILLPLLEYLDAQDFTRRSGDKRILV